MKVAGTSQDARLFSKIDLRSLKLLTSLADCEGDGRGSHPNLLPPEDLSMTTFITAALLRYDTSGNRKS